MKEGLVLLLWKGVELCKIVGDLMDRDFLIFLLPLEAAYEAGIQPLNGWVEHAGTHPVLPSTRDHV